MSTNYKTDSRMTFTKEPALRRIERIQEMLRAKDMTLQEIADGIHLSLRWAREYIVHLRINRLIHIAGFRLHHMEHKTVSHALYCWGAATDAAKPLPLTSAERAQRQRDILMSDQDLHEAALRKRRAARIVPARDWAASWIPTKGAV